MQTQSHIDGGLALTARDPVFAERPHERLDRLRAANPVFQDRDFDRVVLTRAVDIATMMADRTLSSDPFKGRLTTHGRRGLTEADRGRFSMLQMDDPDHTRLRGLVAQAFTARAVKALQPRIEAICSDLLDRVDTDRPFDLIAAYAAPLPTLVIAAMLGVDEGDVEQFKRWSDDIVAVPTSDPSQDAQRRRGGVRRHPRLHQGCARRAAECPRADLISALARAESEGESLSEAEIVSVALLLLLAGNLTTTDLIGNGVVALLRHPEQLACLRSDHALWPDAVEEILRFDPPFTAVSRYTTHDRQIGNCPVEAGQTVTAMLLAANHDPALHPEPHAFDIGRAHRKHYSFGGGAHFCLGASLARLEACIALPALFERFPQLCLASPHMLRRKNVPGFNGYKAVWLRAG